MDEVLSRKEVEIDEETAICILQNTFISRDKVMSSNAGATYQRAATALFHDMIHKEIEVYVDDMIIQVNPPFGRTDKVMISKEELTYPRGINKMSQTPQPMSPSVMNELAKGLHQVSLTPRTIFSEYRLTTDFRQVPRSA